MAFTGSATIVQVNDRFLRITGLTLAAANTTGTIGLFGNTGPAPDVTLPAGFRASAFTFTGAVGLQDAVRVNINPVSSGALTNLMPSVAKTGTTVGDFRISITNTSASLATQDLEIEIEFCSPFVGEPARIA